MKKVSALALCISVAAVLVGACAQDDDPKSASVDAADTETDPDAAHEAGGGDANPDDVGPDADPNDADDAEPVDTAQHDDADAEPDDADAGPDDADAGPDVDDPEIVEITLDPAELEELQMDEVVLVGATCVTAEGVTLDPCAKWLFWSTEDHNVATVDPSGLISAHLPGVTTVRASVGDVLAEIEVSVSAEGITEVEYLWLESSSYFVPAGETVAIPLVCELANTDVFDCAPLATWTSQAPEIAWVAEGGLVTGVSDGVTKLVASAFGQSVSVSVSVLGNTKVVDIKPDINVVVDPGGTYQLWANCQIDGINTECTDLVDWLSLEPAVLTVGKGPDDAGLVTGVSHGTTLVMATLGDDVDLFEVSVTLGELVSHAPVPADPVLVLGSTLQMGVDCTYEGGTGVDCSELALWSVEDASVAEIGPGGLLAALSPGETTLTVSVNANPSETTVTVVSDEVLALTLAPEAPSLAVDEALQLTATCAYDLGLSVDCTEDATWTSSDPEIAQVSNLAGSHGVILAKSAGTVMVTATLGELSATTEVTVQAP